VELQRHGITDGITEIEGSQWKERTDKNIRDDATKGK
jgi:hypothetical protein